jgi:hypothetical protein
MADDDGTDGRYLVSVDNGAIYLRTDDLANAREYCAWLNDDFLRSTPVGHAAVYEVDAMGSITPVPDSAP